jgi:hypothetical protein
MDKKGRNEGVLLAPAVVGLVLAAALTGRKDDGPNTLNPQDPETTGAFLTHYLFSRAAEAV